MHQVLHIKRKSPKLVKITSVFKKQLKKLLYDITGKDCCNHKKFIIAIEKLHLKTCLVVYGRCGYEHY